MQFDKLPIEKLADDTSPCVEALNSDKNDY